MNFCETDFIPAHSAFLLEAHQPRQGMHSGGILSKKQPQSLFKGEPASHFHLEVCTPTHRCQMCKQIMALGWPRGLIFMPVIAIRSPPSSPITLYTYRASVVSPRGPLHLADLDVEGKVLDRDHAAGSEYAVREPHHLPVVRHDCVRVDDGVVVVGIRAVTWHSSE